MSMSALMSKYISVINMLCAQTALDHSAANVRLVLLETVLIVRVRESLDFIIFKGFWLSK